jgi:tetratricopeptide (TPR) repeat protein/predicted Ser/Thr protein kinase
MGRTSRYLVIEEVGRGGMGIVLRAYDPTLAREVAVKVVRADKLSDEARRRLVREARAMAKLNHPNVVEVYDVETDTNDGIGVVMEYVHGPTLQAWLQNAPRSWADVLDVLLAAGRGLAAAHATGLVHRDFKPANVLVGADGRVRVTDFGLAREALPEPTGGLPATAHSPDADALTGGGTIVGTLQYMAPERLQGAPASAATDQFAYCVALWEAIFGQRPFAGNTMIDLAVEMSAGRPRPPLGGARVPAWLLDALHRGLSEDPALRWPSMESLLAALQRGRARKRMRWVLLGLAAASLAAVVAFAWRHAATERRITACIAEGEALASLWNDARAEAIAYAFAATPVAYANDTWDRARPRVDAYAARWDALHRRACERAIAGNANERRSAEASIACLRERVDELAALLDLLGDPDDSVVQHSATALASLPLLQTCADEAALALRPELPADPAMQTRIRDLRAGLAQASAARATGRYEEARAQAEAILVAATDVGSRPLQAEARLSRAQAWDAQGRYEDASRDLMEAFFQASAAGRDEIALEAANALVFVLGASLARPDDGLRWNRRAEALVHRLGLTEGLAEAMRANNVGVVHLQQGQHAEAIAAHERALAIQERLVGSDHPFVAASLGNIGNALRAQGAYERCAETHARALAIWEQAVGPHHPQVAMALNNLGNCEALRNHDASALEYHRRALAIWEDSLGPDHPKVAAALNNLGVLLSVQGELDDALRCYRRALAIREKALGPEHPEVATSLHNIAYIDQKQHDHAQALMHLERALTIQSAALGPDHPDVGTTLSSIGGVYEETGELRRAAAAYEKALAIRERAAAGPLQLARTRFGLARVLWASDPARSRALALAARDEYRSLGEPWAESLSAVEAWLEAHPPR